MTAYRTTVTAPVFGLRREIDRLFEDTFGGPNGTRAGGWVPAVDVREDDRTLACSIELPGLKPDEVEITHENGVLTVRGEKREARKEGDESTRYHVVERAYGPFARSFQLPKGLDDSKIEARFEHGVLTIFVPKAALPQPKKIAITSPEAASTRPKGQ